LAAWGCWNAARCCGFAAAGGVLRCQLIWLFLLDFHFCIAASLLNFAASGLLNAACRKLLLGLSNGWQQSKPEKCEADCQNCILDFHSRTPFLSVRNLTSTREVRKQDVLVTL